MKFYEKCAAARATLNWSRDDLSAESGIPSPTIRNFERGQYVPKESIQYAIEKAFSKEGIVFTDLGIEKRDLFITIFKNYMEVLDDILETIEPGEEILFNCGDDARSSDIVNLKLEELRSKGYIFRSTICEGNTYIKGHYSEYRWIPKEYFAESEISVIYGNKYVQHVPGEQKGLFIMLHSKQHANILRKQFEYWWSNGKEVRI